MRMHMKSEMRPYDIRCNGVVIRPPRVTDGPKIMTMVRESAVLDVNSDYAYLLMCTHFSMTSAFAQDGDENVGFVIAYLPPDQPEILFVWQICIRSGYRGLGLGHLLIESLLHRPGCRGVRFVEATVNPSNLASQRLFQSLAKKYSTECQTSKFFPKDLFGSGNHEEELLFRVGPLRCNDQKE